VVLNTLSPAPGIGEADDSDVFGTFGQSQNSTNGEEEKEEQMED
jgi:NCS1 family nucleobase:cation symporter-1